MDTSKLALVVLVITAGLGIVIATALLVPPGIDWWQVYRPATWELLHLRNPYDLGGYHNPPWALLLLVPMALFPVNIGYGILVLVSITSIAYSAVKRGATPITFIALLLSPPILHSLLNGQTEWMPLLGFALPAQIGLFLVMVKPQMGSVVAIFWLVEAWRNGGVREVIRVFGPITIATLLSFVLFGFWPATFGRLTTLWWNASLWPASIPVGLALTVAAIRSRKIEYAMSASPCLSPYVLLHSWSGALAALIRSPWEMAAAVVGLWVLVLIRSGLLSAF